VVQNEMQMGEVYHARLRHQVSEKTTCGDGT
jgi:hypothetical protein